MFSGRVQCFIKEIYYQRSHYSTPTHCMGQRFAHSQYLRLCACVSVFRPFSLHSQMLSNDHSYVEKVRKLTHRFRDAMGAAGFTVLGARSHPICPVLLGDARLATQVADALLLKGLFVVGFSFPVVPKGQARIRTQISAAHTEEDIDFAARAFIEAGRQFGVIQ